MMNVLRYVLGGIITLLLLMLMLFNKPEVKAPEPISVTKTVVKEVIVEGPQVLVIYKARTRRLVCEQPKVEPSQTIYLRKAPNKNRLALNLGAGQNGIRTDAVGNAVEVSSATTAVIGLSYDRLVSKEIFVGAAILSNGTGLLRVGVEY